MKARLEPVPEIDVLGVRWRDLESRAEPSFFQSWTWIGSWLGALPGLSSIHLLSIEADGVPVGLGLLGMRMLRRHRLLPVRGLFLNETGDSSLDTLTVEHNGLLLQGSLAERGIGAAIRHLRTALPSWDELQISGVEGRIADDLRRAFPIPGCRLVTRTEKPYFTVALDRLRKEGRDYLTTLSSNARSQLRRSRREYEKEGPLAVRIAADERQAYRYFDNLQELHQSHWIARGAPGAFATPFAKDFHRRLIATGMPRGEIQLAEITCGSQAIGYLYNFLHRGVVSNYQGGFRYSNNPHLKPGLVAHQLLIEENLRQGARIYDFLMGDHRYKKSLATDEGRMCELVVQRNRLRFRLEDLARTVVTVVRRRGISR